VSQLNWIRKETKGAKKAKVANMYARRVGTVKEVKVLKAFIIQV
jgi:hypothetical protein